MRNFALYHGFNGTLPWFQWYATMVSMVRYHGFNGTLPWFQWYATMVSMVRYHGFNGKISTLHLTQTYYFNP